ncbi:MAG: sigma factor-like helix-turn-helix DNA-binding protein [Terriglobales bacterium]
METRFTWQAAKSAELESQLQRLQQKIGRLLVMFSPQLVHLHGRLSHHNAREGNSCALDLHLPTGQLAAEKSAATSQAALHAAGEDLLEQIKRHKDRLRSEQGRNGHATLRTLPSPDRLPSAPPDREAERQDLSRYIAANVDALQRFVQRQLELRARLGQIRPKQLDPREVLDEMIVEALAASDGNHPAPPRWFYLLAVNAIRRLAPLAGQDYGGAPALSLDRELGDDEVRREEQNYEFFAPGEGADAAVGDLTPDPTMATPEDIAYSSEMVTLLAAALQRLPAQQREQLVLFALEGFSIEELAMLSGRPPGTVRAELQAASLALEQQTDIPGDLRRRLVEQAAQLL